MPLVTLTTKAAWHPDTNVPHISLEPKPKKIVDFGRALPEIMVRNHDKLFLDQSTPLTGVQVSHKLANSHDVNAPDLWIEIRFTEDDLSEIYQTAATAELKRLVYGWFWDYMPHETETPKHLLERFDVACDVHWPNGSHGFLKIGDEALDW